MNTPSQPGLGSGGVPPWAPPSPEALSAALPAYEVSELLGRGGMGAVYRAVQRSLKRAVAIKVLPRSAADDELKFAERFRHEAETLARLNHPGIVHIHDFGETADGLLYLVMEFVDGTDVQRLLHGSGRLPEDHALAVTAHVCDALAYAHSRGVVHRDIKPANVLIDQDGNVKVADFGLAKMVDPQFDSGLTMSNVALGTPDYVAPEVLSYGMEADHRADLYAVGVMLYQMLTGEVPRGLFKLPSQRGFVSDERWDEIICRAMEPDRDERYQSAVEVRQALDLILTGPLPIHEETNLVPVSAKAKRTTGRWLAWGGLVVGAVAVAAIVNFALNRPTTEETPTVSPLDETFLREVAGAAPERQVELVREKIESLNGTEVTLVPTITTSGTVTKLTVDQTDRVDVPDLSPLAGLRDLTDLTIRSPGLREIAWLNGMKIKTLSITSGVFTDLGPLKTLPIQFLTLLSCRGTEFSGLAGVPLRSLSLYGGGPIHDLGFVGEMPLETMSIGKMGVKDWSPLRGLPVRDLTVDLDPKREAEILRSLPNLRKFNGKPVEELWSLIGSPVDGPSSQATQDRSMSGKSPPLESDTGAITWTDVTETVREKAAANPALEVDADGIRRAGDGSPVGIPVTDPSWRNYAIRIRHSADTQINLRSGDHGMVYVLCQGTKTLIHRHDTGATEPVVLEAGVAHPAGFDINETHELVATVEDNLFRAWVDGCPAGQVRDNAFATGAGTVMWVRQSAVRSVEVAPLPESPHRTMREGFWGQVKGVNAERQVEIIEGALESINQNELSIKPTFEGGKVVMLNITRKSGDPLHDLAPVSALTDLKTLFCYAPGVRDLDWLRGLPIEHLQLEHAAVENLAVLKGTMINHLDLDFPEKVPSDYSVLAGMPLRSLSLQDCRIDALSFLSGMPLNRLVLTGTGISDYAPLTSLPLAEVDLDLVPERDLPILLSIPTLKKINGKPVEEYRRDSPIVANQQIWTDWLGPRLADPNQFLGGGWIREDGGVTTDQPLKGTVLFPPGTRDGAARVVFSLRDSEGVIVNLREWRDESGLHMYIAQYTGKNLYIAYRPPLVTETIRLVNQPIPDSVRSRPEHTLEFRVVGDQLEATLDGEFRASTRHSLIEEGTGAIVLTKGALVKSIETMELPQGAGPPPALSSPNRGGGAPAP